MSCGGVERLTVEALQRLRDTPRVGNEKGCAREEAAAVQTLKKLEQR